MVHTLLIHPHLAMAPVNTCQNGFKALRANAVRILDQASGLKKIR